MDFIEGDVVVCEVLFMQGGLKEKLFCKWCCCGGVCNCKLGEGVVEQVLDIVGDIVSGFDD